MKHLLNTLYVTTPGAYLCREGETVVVRVEQETKLQVPVAALEGIVCIGGVGFTPPLMELCAERGVHVSFLTEHGRFMARVSGPVSGNILLRKEQYRRADDPEKTAALAAGFVIGKIANCRTVLLRAGRDAKDREAVESFSKCADYLGNIIDRLRKETDIETVRGKEGEAGHAYFSVFDRFIVSQKEGFFFKERTRRPPLDNVNALLSFIYTLLAHDCVGACESVGLDPQAGYLHADRPGRPGLALDLMEEFRPFIADRLALTLINRQQVKPDGFKITESGAVTMTPETKKEVIKAYQERKREELEHPFLREKAAIGLFPYLQARILARHLRGDLDGYPPFVWK
ncbi:MAG: type I-C CRISPR-associated endonuclease Cas1 [Chitinispirillaceae bacterium]|nr:type I-C CRISPR-associated endonuclease Cas1 [Chitinispirillaceae bacterium]